MHVRFAHSTTRPPATRTPPSLFFIILNIQQPIALSTTSSLFSLRSTQRVSTDRGAKDGGDPLCTLHWAEGLYTVQLGYTQGVYEFLIQKFIRYTPATQAGLYWAWPLYGSTAQLWTYCNRGGGKVVLLVCPPLYAELLKIRNIIIHQPKAQFSYQSKYLISQLVFLLSN